MPCALPSAPFRAARSVAARPRGSWADRSADNTVFSRYGEADRNPNGKDARTVDYGQSTDTEQGERRSPVACSALSGGAACAFAFPPAGPLESRPKPGDADDEPILDHVRQAARRAARARRVR